MKLFRVILSFIGAIFISVSYTIKYEIEPSEIALTGFCVSFLVIERISYLFRRDEE